MILSPGLLWILRIFSFSYFPSNRKEGGGWCSCEGIQSLLHENRRYKGLSDWPFYHYGMCTECPCKMCHLWSRACLFDGVLIAGESHHCQNIFWPLNCEWLRRACLAVLGGSKWRLCHIFRKELHSGAAGGKAGQHCGELGKRTSWVQAHWDQESQLILVEQGYWKLRWIDGIELPLVTSVQFWRWTNIFIILL